MMAWRVQEGKEGGLGRWNMEDNSAFLTYMYDCKMVFPYVNFHKSNSPLTQISSATFSPIVHLSWQLGSSGLVGSYLMRWWIWR